MTKKVKNHAENYTKTYQRVVQYYPIEVLIDVPQFLDLGYPCRMVPVFINQLTIIQFNPELRSHRTNL